MQTVTTLEANRRRMIALLAELTTGEGLRPSILDEVRLGRADRGYDRAPVLYESSIYIVASGRKIGFIGDRRFVYAHYAESFSVGRLAADVAMSVSAFHHQFKALTGSSPVQYLKSVRLHKARALIVNEGTGAAIAATSVGYESASQFSREFKRFFGASPIEEARRMRPFIADPAVVDARATS